MAPTNDSSDQATNYLCEFLIVCTHAILHANQVYPAKLFVPRRKYDLTTMYCKHPTLTSYIKSTITALHPWLKSGQVQSVSIPLFTRTGKPPTKTVHARYVFEIATLSALSPSANDLGCLNMQLRAHLCRILAEVRPPVVAEEKEVLWDFVVRTSGVRVGTDWVPADGEERAEIAHPVALPLKDADSGANTFAIASRVEFSDEEG